MTANEIMERERRHHPEDLMKVITSSTTLTKDDFSVTFVVYEYTAPEWESPSGQHYEERTGTRYIVSPSTGGGCGGEIP